MSTEAVGRVHHRRRSISPQRAASALVLSAWAALFWYLLLTGRSSFYLSPRTDWVVPVGAVILTGAAAGRFASVRVPSPTPMARVEAWGLGLVVVPVVVVLALPPAALGSYAAARRSSFSSVGFESSAKDIASGDLSLIDLAGAQQSRSGQKALTARAGSDVSFVGFVTRDAGMPADEFRLTRFIVSCCVADALSVQVRVVGAPPGRFESDEWVRVEGAMYPLTDEVVVQAASVVKVGRPEHPYLSP